MNRVIRAFFYSLMLLYFLLALCGIVAAWKFEVPLPGGVAAVMGVAGMIVARMDMKTALERERLKRAIEHSKV